MGLAVARFCRWYPGMYVSSEWPTADHVIPWRLFAILYGRLHRVLALDRLNAGLAGAFAIGVTHAEESVANRVTDDLMSEALPEG